MTRLLDGPGHGVTFMLRNAPTYLRAVQGPTRWDALDQLNDTPEPDEHVHVYQRVEDTYALMHMRPGGCYAMADYQHVPDAPTELLRDNARWRAWATLQHAAATINGRPLPTGVAADLAKLKPDEFRAAAADLGAVEADGCWTIR